MWSSMLMCVFLPRLCVLAPWTHGQQWLSAERHAAQCSYGQPHLGAEGGAGFHHRWQQRLASNRTCFNFFQLIVHFVYSQMLWSSFCDAVSCAAVCSVLVQLRRQRETMRWTGGSSFWIYGSAGTLGPCCFHSRNNQKVKAWFLLFVLCLNECIGQAFRGSMDEK